MTLNELMEKIHSGEQEVIILEPQSQFNRGIIGFEDQTGCLVYSVEILFDIYCDDWGVEKNEQSWMEVLDFIGYNISFGAKTPLIWVSDDLDDEVDIPEKHFAVRNYEDEIRVLPFLAKLERTTTIE